MSVDIVFTGGGTAGHVTPNLALMDGLDGKYSFAYIGAKHGIEATMLAEKKVPFYAVRSGKLRRYFSFKNFIDPINVVIGIVQAYFRLWRLKPKLVFSKGGFVSLPVVIAAWCHRIPIIAHESDLSPGLANRISYPFVTKICVTFQKGKEYFKNQDKLVVTGTPIRPELFQGNKEQGLKIAGFSGKKPCLMIMGGSQGSAVINDCVRSHIEDFCERFHVLHICGKGKCDDRYAEQKDYYQVEYAFDDLPHFFAAADVVISRAGANSLYELLALQKPHILIPLSKRSSRGDQIANAFYFQDKGAGVVLTEEKLTAKQLFALSESVYEGRSNYIARMKALDIVSATPVLINLIEEVIAE